MTVPVDGVPLRRVSTGRPNRPIWSVSAGAGLSQLTLSCRIGADWVRWTVFPTSHDVASQTAWPKEFAESDAIRADGRLAQAVPRLRHVAGTPVSQFTIATALAVTTSFFSGCDRFKDSQTVSDVEIRLDVPDDPAGAAVTLSGLPPAVVAALRHASLEREDWTSLLRVTVHRPDSPGRTRHPSLEITRLVRTTSFGSARCSRLIRAGSTRSRLTPQSSLARFRLETLGCQRS